MVDVIEELLNSVALHEESKAVLMACLQEMAEDKVVNVKEMAERAVAKLKSKE